MGKFLGVSAILNIVLDLWFVIGLDRGVAGAAKATVIAQYVSGIGMAVYSLKCVPYLKMKKEEFRVRWNCMREITGFSVLTCVQQSVMNLGILLVQGVVNSFGASVMAAFAAAVKLMHSPICRYRISEMLFLHLLLRITELKKRRFLPKGFVTCELRVSFIVESDVYFCCTGFTVLWADPGCR